MKARVIIVDDNPRLVTRIAALLAAEYDVVATAADGESALGLSDLHKPDVIILDVGLPGLNGIEVTKRLVTSSTHVVICSMESDPLIMEAARQAGAQGYVVKMRLERDLIPALRSVLAGKSFVSPAI